MIREKIKKLVEDACKKVFKDRKSIVSIEKPPKEKFGDYTAKVYFLSLKKRYSSSLPEIMILPSLKECIRLIDEIKKSPIFSKFFLDVEFQEPFFINFFVSKEYLQKQIKEILKTQDKFGNLKIGKNQKVNVEFISANPTGPLTLGNGRGGFCGDVLANVLNKAGFKIKREYYINDVGEQIRKLGHSVIGDSEAVYKGKYIEDLRRRIKGTDSEKVGEKAAKIILKKMIKPAVKKMGIDFNVWLSEKSLYKNKEVDRILNLLKNKRLAYKKEGALWFKSSQFGDDKDRVLVKANGEKTYFASDIAYLKNKFKRGFKKLIFFWGADHYGYVKRIEAAVEAIGYEKEQTDFIIMQLVRLFEKGEQVRMSKRANTYVTLEELIDQVGLDAARFFFLTRSSGSHLDFDLGLAKERSEKNPVYYVQYAHARICSILRKSKSFKCNPTGSLLLRSIQQVSSFKLLNHSSELALIKQLIKFPEIIEDTAKDYQVQRLPQYAIDLATVFHRFYRVCRVMSDDKKLSQARLSLILSTKIVLKNTLNLMGISAPEKM